MVWHSYVTSTLRITDMRQRSSSSSPSSSTLLQQLASNVRAFSAQPATPNPPSPVARLMMDVGHNAIGYATALGGVMIVTMLVLSTRTTLRGERAQKLIQQAERKILNNTEVVSKVGHVFAGGNYQMSITNLEASGWYSASLPGKVKGKVYLTANRTNKKANWEFPTLKLEIDKIALEQRANSRREAAINAGYINENSKDPRNEATAIQIYKGNVPSTDPNVITFQIFPPVEDVANPSSDSTTSVVNDTMKKELQ